MNVATEARKNEIEEIKNIAPAKSDNRIVVVDGTANPNGAKRSPTKFRRPIQKM